MSIAIFHEHPEWNRPLFEELERRGIDWVSIDAGSQPFDPDQIDEWDLVVSRMSPSAWTRGHVEAMLQTPRFLHNLEDAGIPVINGSRAYEYELSKRNQLALFQREHVRHPEGRPVLSPDEIEGAASDLRFPVMVKPNIGGSGAGITVHDSQDELAMASRTGLLDDLGPDGTGIVQEKLAAAGDSIVRIEILGDQFLYAIRLKLLPGSFNLCPADYCDPTDAKAGSPDLVVGYDPPLELKEEARRVIKAAAADLGGVEYLINEEDGKAYFYDINALSNFVADAPRVIGFDPFVDLVDFIEDRVNSTARTDR